MPNPYHDAEGKFASRDEMKAAIDTALHSGDVTTAMRMQDEFDVADRKNAEEAGLTFSMKKLGVREWRNRDGLLHREDGAAQEFDSGTKAWFIDGRLHRDGAPAVQESTGGEEWWKNGQLHRAGDEPAVTRADGTKEWWKLNRPHRSGGKPAIVRGDGTQVWYSHGIKHRLYAPAVVNPDGSGEYWVYGEQKTREQMLADYGPNIT